MSRKAKTEETAPTPTELPPDLAALRMLPTVQAMAITGFSKSKFFAIQRSNDAIPSYKFGKSRRYQLQELLGWIDKHKES